MSSSDLRCPYCPETRPSRSRMSDHIRSAHKDADFVQASAASERLAHEPLAHPNAARFDATQMLDEAVRKCPYCPETRSGTSALAGHLHQTHATPVKSAVRLAGMATLVTVAVPYNELKCPHCTQTRLSVMTLTNHLRQGHHIPVKDAQRQAAAVASLAAKVGQAEAPPVCICGDPIQLLDDEPDLWIHAPGSSTPCLDPAPAKQTIATQGRKQLSERLTETGANLAKAGSDIADLKAKADATLKRLEALDAQIMDPATVRRATLNQVWDKLIDEGNIAGATIVMRMISNMSEGNWS